MWAFVKMRRQRELLKKLLIEKKPIDDLMPFSDLKLLTAKYIYTEFGRKNGMKLS